MTFKTHKIRNIDKSICCAEQKIAYNYAFSYRSILEKAKQNKKLQETINQTINWMTKDFEREEINKRYNTKIILICYKTGIEKYLNGFSILTNYKEIGNIFSFPYDIE